MKNSGGIMKRISVIVFYLFMIGVILSGCKKNDSPTSQNSAKTGLIGKWKILTSNGVDVSAYDMTLDITEKQITMQIPTYSCTKVYSYTTSGNNYSTTLQSTTCNQGSDSSNVPGYKAGGTYSISGNKLTMKESGGTVNVCERIN